MHTATTAVQTLEYARKKTLLDSQSKLGLGRAWVTVVTCAPRLVLKSWEEGAKVPEAGIRKVLLDPYLYYQ
jgi:hypothetical protein